jgi:hypothetical protein
MTDLEREIVSYSASVFNDGCKMTQEVYSKAVWYLRQWKKLNPKYSSLSESKCGLKSAYRAMLNEIKSDK